MTEIEERLRNHAGEPCIEDNCDMREAAELIRELRAALAKAESERDDRIDHDVACGVWGQRGCSCPLATTS